MIQYCLIDIGRALSHSRDSDETLAAAGIIAIDEIHQERVRHMITEERVRLSRLIALMHTSINLISRLCDCFRGLINALSRSLISCL